MQVVLDAGYRALWSDMDTAWLKNFFELAPSDRDVVLVDDSEEEDEQISDNTCTGTVGTRPASHGFEPACIYMSWHCLCIRHLQVPNLPLSCVQPEHDEPHITQTCIVLHGGMEETYAQ
jgi:hypothetical protein